MRWLVASVRPLSAFGTPLRGDTLFGQLCWAIRHRLGETRLERLLDGYTEGRPFLIVSDAFPDGFLPRPELPPPSVDPLHRKKVKKGRYLAARLFHGPMPAVPDERDVAEEPFKTAAQPHNSISRLTGTTGTGFDPFQMERRWPSRPGERKMGERAADVRLWVHLLLDEARLARSDLEIVLSDVGAWGFGRDASIGLGRFAVEGWADGRPVQAEGANAFLALAPSAHAPGSLDAERSFHRPFVRFGRHGADAATAAKPFKMPVLLMDSGAVLRPSTFEPGALFLGRGLGGGGRISAEMPGTVHQGYAPVIPIVARWADAARSAA